MRRGALPAAAVRLPGALRADARPTPRRVAAADQSRRRSARARTSRGRAGRAAPRSLGRAPGRARPTCCVTKGQEGPTNTAQRCGFAAQQPFTRGSLPLLLRHLHPKLRKAISLEPSRLPGSPRSAPDSSRSRRHARPRALPREKLLLFRGTKHPAVGLANRPGWRPAEGRDTARSDCGVATATAATLRPRTHQTGNLSPQTAYRTRRLGEKRVGIKSSCCAEDEPITGS